MFTPASVSETGQVDNEVFEPQAGEVLVQLQHLRNLGSFYTSFLADRNQLQQPRYALLRSARLRCTLQSMQAYHHVDMNLAVQLHVLAEFIDAGARL